MTHPDINLSKALVQAISQARITPLPSWVIEKIKLHVADAFAIGIAARAETISQLVTKGQLAGSGSGPCELLNGGTAPAVAASFINSALIHILDFDDIHDAGRLHPGTVVIPAVMAAAQLKNTSDEQIIEAIAYASELMCRLGAIAAPEGKGPGSEWFLTQLFGYVAAAIGAGIVLGLSQEKLVSAIGLAYMQAAGGKEAGFGVGSNARSIYPAFASQGGLQAALLASAGVAGPESALDGTASLFQIYFGRQLTPSKRRLLLDFDRWDFQDTEIKPWPSCRLSHPYIAVANAARSIVMKYPNATIRVSVNASAARLCHPYLERRKPETLQDAKYSIPFMTAFTLVYGYPTLKNLSTKTLHDADVLKMALRVETQEVLADNPGHPLAVLTVIEDQTVIHTSQFLKSDLQIDGSEIESKVMTCFEYANASGIASAVFSQIKQGHLMNALSLIAAQPPQGD